VPDLRIAYDSGNIHIAGEDSVQGYKNNQEQITHMHFKDFSANGKLCIPGQGIIDFPNLIKAMKKANYSGYINLEVPTKQPGGYEAYEKAMEKLNPLILNS
jgi:inosose dehydratase